MARRLDLTKVFTFSIIGIMLISGIAVFLTTKYVMRYDNHCRTLGGVPLHGSGIDLCLKPEVLLGEENGQLS